MFFAAHYTQYEYKGAREDTMPILQAFGPSAGRAPAPPPIAGAATGAPPVDGPKACRIGIATSEASNYALIEHN